MTQREHLAKQMRDIPTRDRRRSPAKSRSPEELKRKYKELKRDLYNRELSKQELEVKLAETIAAADAEKLLMQEKIQSTKTEASAVRQLSDEKDKEIMILTDKLKSMENDLEEARRKSEEYIEREQRDRTLMESDRVTIVDLEKEIEMLSDAYSQLELTFFNVVAPVRSKV
jgi:chromosome segregation ATPase